MAEFILNTPIDTKEPGIEVTISPRAPLKVGLHRFQLVVYDDSKNESKPSVVEVRVLDTQAPTAILRGPSAVGIGQSFKLDGSESTDLGGGTIVAYQWTYLGPVG